MDKDEIAKKYFREIKPKHLKEFETETPNGNIIKGVICKKANFSLGSMLITEIYIKEKDLSFQTEQFIQAMPKIHYYDNNHSMYSEEEVKYNCYEKLDGSCLILYGIYYNNEVIEVIPKTRGLPVADSHIIDMFNELDHSNIESFFSKCKDVNPTLIFELYGALNQHSIFYPSVRIDIALIGCTENGKFLCDNELHWIAKQYDFKRPNKVFTLVYYNNTWRINISPGIYAFYFYDGIPERNVEKVNLMAYPTQYDAIIGIKDMITRINASFSKKHNRSLLEGVVIDSFNMTGDHFMYLKVKSADIEEKCRTENGVPRKFILKEVHKYFDEYGSRAKEIYQEDENHVVEYVNRNLLEEFDANAVNMKRTQSRIKNVFLDMLEAKEPPKGLQDICHDLVEKYPGSDVSDLMRLFAQEYPEKKRHANLVYGIFVKIS